VGRRPLLGKLGGRSPTVLRRGYAWTPGGAPSNVRLQQPAVCLTAFPLVNRVESSSKQAFPRVGRTCEITPSCQKGLPPDKKKKKKKKHDNLDLTTTS